MTKRHFVTAPLCLSVIYMDAGTIILKMLRKIIIITGVFTLVTALTSWAGDSFIFEVIVKIDAAAPQTTDNYDRQWHNEDFVIYLTAADTQSGIEDTYYKINNSPQYCLKTAGQPRISTEGDNNILEYWSVDKAGNEEIPHHILTGIKLDKTAPVITITCPQNETALDKGPLTIGGKVDDSLSGVNNIEIKAGEKIYAAEVNPDKSFSAAEVEIVNGPNKITVATQDSAGNTAEAEVTVFLGWVLHLPVPYYQADSYGTAAACCQIILNYIRNGVLDPARELTGEEIYNYGHQFNYEQNSSLGEMDPRAIDYTLGHFDPYDSNDPADEGDTNHAYNFGIESFEKNEFTGYLRDIVHWMAYPVTIDNWQLDGELTAQSNTPAVVPLYGNYEHWIVVNGAATSENPAPNPHINPWNTPDFIIYGLWLTDPRSDGIGRDLYVLAQGLPDTYFLPLTTPDKHNGKYLHVSEPPRVSSSAHIELAEPLVNEETLKTIELAQNITQPVLSAVDSTAQLSDFEQRMREIKRHIYDCALSVDLENDSKLSGKTISDTEGNDLNSVFDIDESLPVELDWKKIVEPSLLTDESFRTAFDDSQARDFVKVRRMDKENSFYYLIPFDKYVKGRFLTCAAIIIDAQTGSFQEASWVKQPARFIQINQEKAISLVLSQKDLVPSAELNAELVWQPAGLSSSPFYPYWRITNGAEVCFVTQKGEIIKEGGYNE